MYIQMCILYVSPHIHMYVPPSRAEPCHIDRAWCATGGSRNFLGVEKSAFAIAFDLSFGSRNASERKSFADLVDRQSVTELVAVLLWPAKAGRVIHAISVPENLERATYLSTTTSNATTSHGAKP